MPPLITWRDSYALGIDEVDEDHRALVKLINDLHAALNAGAGEADIVRFLCEVHARIASHFVAEERIMRESAYAGYEAHKADHDRLLEEIRGIIENYAEAYTLAPDLLGINLEDWFMVHFRTHDARLHGLQQARQASA